MRGKFVTLEGIDGAGKSSHVGALAQHLRDSKHVEVIVTREPGGTAIGEKIRDLLLQESMRPDTELLLMFAARSEHVAQVIEPALERGAWVLSDRFTDASYAYQGGGRGLATARIAALEQWVHDGLQPDRTLIFDVDLKTAQQRLAATNVAADRFELEAQAFFERVRSAYAARARNDPQRVRVIDSTQTLADVKRQVLLAVEDL